MGDVMLALARTFASRSLRRIAISMAAYTWASTMGLRTYP